jgi:16S rRNA (adenine1518-N6/adenine1519-N6)-dimethyltransferase
MNQLEAKKKFGQNFLVDKNAQDRVKSAMKALVDQYDNRVILEIGPGQGDMTQHIVDFGRRVVALEIDPEAVEIVANRFVDRNNLTLIQTDATRSITGENDDLKSFGSDFILLASLPYNVGSRILVDMGVSYPSVPFCVILQKEVIQKVVRRDSFTFFGAWLNLFWDLKNVLDLSPNVFSPKPKVYSGLMRGIPKADLPEIYQTVEKRKIAKETLKKLFANPSKTLSNNLKNLDWSNEQINLFLEKNHLDVKTRLGWENYQQILEEVLTFYK